MKVRNLLVVGVSVCGLSMIIGCSKVPQDELNKATLLIDSVKVETEQLAPQEYNAARGMLDSALAEIKKENAKMAIVRDYEKTKKMLAASVVSATAAREVAAKNKASMSAEVQAAITAVQASLEEVKKMVAEAFKSKKARKNAALATAENDLKTAETAIADAVQQLAAESFSLAQEKTAAVNQQLETMKAAIANGSAAKK